MLDFSYAKLNQKIDLEKKVIIYKRYKPNDFNSKLDSRIIGPYYRPYNRIALIRKIPEITLMELYWRSKS